MLLSLRRSFRVYFQSRADLQTEILALRHQIVVLQLMKKEVDDRLWTTEHHTKRQKKRNLLIKGPLLRLALYHSRRHFDGVLCKNQKLDGCISPAW
jgi:hypothetical protein